MGVDAPTKGFVTLQKEYYNMSYDLTSLSFKQTGLSASEKHVLTILAFRCNEYSKCWPSIKSITLDSSLDRKTVQAALVSLQEKNIIKRTGEFKGKTKSTPVYKLNLSDPKNGTSSRVSDPVFSRSDPKNGTAKRSQKRDTEYKEEIKKESSSSFSLTPKETLEYSDYRNDFKTRMKLGLIDKDSIPLTDIEFKQQGETQ